MSPSYLADVNLLLALTVKSHGQHVAAISWAEEKQPAMMAVCRVVQLGFLRLLTTAAALREDTLTNREAWDVFDQLTVSGMVQLVQEPILLHQKMREKSTLERPAPKRWNDAYLSAFATAANLRLVTFDEGLASYTPHSILLRS